MNTANTQFTHDQVAVILALAAKGHTPRAIAAYVSALPNSPHRTTAAIKARIARGTGVRPPYKAITPADIEALHLPSPDLPIMPQRVDYASYSDYYTAYAKVWNTLSYTDQDAVGIPPPATEPQAKQTKPAPKKQLEWED